MTGLRPLLHSFLHYLSVKQYQSNSFFIQRSSCCPNEIVTACILLVHFCSTTLACTLAFDSEPTFYSHISDIITKWTQVVLLKKFLHQRRYIFIRIFIGVIKQMHVHIAQELIVFSEYDDDGNFKAQLDMVKRSLKVVMPRLGSKWLSQPS